MPKVICFILFLMVALANSNPSPLTKLICGSWIVAQHTYQNPIYLLESTTKYHQMNATVDDTVDGILLSEVDVISGKSIKMLYSIVIDESDGHVTLHSLENDEAFTFHVYSLENGIQVRIGLCDDLVFNVSVSK